MRGCLQVGARPDSGIQLNGFEVGATPKQTRAAPLEIPKMDLTPLGRINMADIGADELAQRESLVRGLAGLFARRGYEPVDTPLLEETELFIRKSGGDLSSRLYSFKEPGGYDVSLRPEFTAQVLRLAATNGIDDLPARFQYAGPVFRYPAQEDGGRPDSGQFWQCGAEIVGPRSAAADGEIIAMAMEGLLSVGARDPAVTVGHVGLMWDVLRPFGLSGRVNLFLVNCVGKLADGGVQEVRDESVRIGLLNEAASRLMGQGMSADGRNEALALVSAVLGETSNPNNSFTGGSRTREEIAERLARKLTQADDPARFDEALELLSAFARLRGSPGDVYAGAKDVLRSAGQDASALQGLSDVVDSALAEGVAEAGVRVDLGLTRDIAYYTGMVFDVTAGGLTVGGGGRYDGLTRALGSNMDVPSLGFAFNIDALSTVVPAVESRRDGVFVAPNGPDAGAAAAQYAAEIREDGSKTVLSFEVPPDVPTLRRWGESAGCSRVAVVNADGTLGTQDLS